MEVKHSDIKETSWSLIESESKTLIVYIIRCAKKFPVKFTDDSRAVTVSRLLYRIVRNLRAVHTLAKDSSQNEDSVFFKLPVGLILRNCLFDSILALHFAYKDEKDSVNLNSLYNNQYVRALLEEFPVYKDKISQNLDDETKRTAFYLSLEDTFLQHLDFNDKMFAQRKDSGTIPPLQEQFMWKPRAYSSLYEGCLKSDGEFKHIKELLGQNENLADNVNSLYAYYKYFSQYEHFSQMGDGDSLVPFGEDNIRFEKTFYHIGQAVRLINLKFSDNIDGVKGVL